jgi:hypothetical protein
LVRGGDVACRAVGTVIRCGQEQPARLLAATRAQFFTFLIGRAKTTCTAGLFGRWPGQSKKDGQQMLLTMEGWLCAGVFGCLVTWALGGIEDEGDQLLLGSLVIFVLAINLVALQHL